MSKKLRFEIKPNGEIRVKTLGMSGEECLDYVELVEKLLDAKTVDSHFTEEYYETIIEQKQTIQQQIKKESD